LASQGYPMPRRCLKPDKCHLGAVVSKGNEGRRGRGGLGSLRDQSLNP
jgi:hypothetical protein